MTSFKNKLLKLYYSFEITWSQTTLNSNKILPKKLKVRPGLRVPKTPPTRKISTIQNFAYLKTTIALLHNKRPWHPDLQLRTLSPREIKTKLWVINFPHPQPNSFELIILPLTKEIRVMTRSWFPYIYTILVPSLALNQSGTCCRQNRQQNSSMSH